MVKEGKLIIELVRGVLQERPVDFDMESINLNKLLVLLERHFLIPFCYQALEKMGSLPDNFMLRAQNTYNLAMAKEASQEIEARLLFDELEREGIKYMPLKGFVLKDLYPKPYMRIAADVDILFDSSKRKRVRKLLLGKGYTIESRRLNHDVYHKKPFMNLEMHMDLMSELVDMHGYFKGVWEKLSLKEGRKYEYVFSTEDFYIFQMAHLYKHFSVSGSGIRSNIDTYIYLEKYGDTMDRSYLDNEFKKLGILDFVKIYEDLTYKWFTEGFSDDEVSLFILSSGNFGIREHFVLSKIINEKGKKMGFNYLVRRTFLPYKRMKSIYPILKKCPILLPLMWLVRIFQYFLRGNTDIGHEIDMARNVNEEKVQKMERIKKKAGVKPKRDL